MRPQLIHDMRFEGLSLTVESVERSLAFYRDMLELEVVHTALPAFALVRAGGGTIGLLSIEVARKAERVNDFGTPGVMSLVCARG